MDMNQVETETKLSTLWIFVMLNMICADILSFMNPEFLQGLMNGHAEGVQITTSFLLLAAVCLEVPITMVFVSRFLKRGINRWVNILAGAFTILFVIGGGSTVPHYIFFATIEIVFLLVIIWYAWKWANTEGGV